MKRLIVSATVPATVLATVLGLVGTALAGEEAFLSGKDLHELCKGGDVSCTTYVMGVLDAVNMMESRSGGGSAFCAPEAPPGPMGLPCGHPGDPGTRGGVPLRRQGRVSAAAGIAFRDRRVARY